MKTTKQWLEVLPPDIKKEAIKYTRINYRGRMPPFKCSSFYVAMIGAFPWDGTNEGFKYWKDITKKYNEYENNKTVV